MLRATPTWHVRPGLSVTILGEKNIFPSILNIRLDNSTSQLSFNPLVQLCACPVPAFRPLIPGCPIPAASPQLPAIGPPSFTHTYSTRMVCASKLRLSCLAQNWWSRWYKWWLPPPVSWCHYKLHWATLLLQPLSCAVCQDPLSSMCVYGIALRELRIKWG